MYPRKWKQHNPPSPRHSLCLVLDTGVPRESQKGHPFHRRHSYFSSAPSWMHRAPSHLLLLTISPSPRHPRPAPLDPSPACYPARELNPARMMAAARQFSPPVCPASGCDPDCLPPSLQPPALPSASEASSSCRRLRHRALAPAIGKQHRRNHKYILFIGIINVSINEEVPYHASSALTQTRYHAE